MRQYDRLTLALPLEEEEPLCAELWGLGSLGMECREVGGETIVEAYFEGGECGAPGDRAADWAERGIRLLESCAMPDRDWLAAYRAAARPFEVGRGWLIDPGEPVDDPPSVSGRVTLRLPARRAFGTGSHETTRLVLEWLEELPVAERQVLDLGSGSGVLSLAAGQLGAASVVAVDLDPVAAVMARDNRRLNGGMFRIVAGIIDCLAGRRFDLALVNISPAAWLSAVDGLAAVLLPGATTIFAGLLVDQSEEFIAAIEPAGFQVEARRQAGEWVALRATNDGCRRGRNR